jgi:hypothetical protein
VNNTGFILLTELHSVSVGNQRTFPLLSFADGESQHVDRFTSFKDEVFRRWAAFNGVPVQHMTYEQMFQAR